MTITLERSPARADVGRAGRAVIVTDANHSVALPFIRSLHSHGLRVIAASHDRGAAGFRSRYVDARFTYPWPGRDEAGFVERVARAARRHDASLVVPLSEAAVVALDRARARLPAACQVALPPSSALTVALSKQRTIELAESLGVPVPTTRVARTVQEAVAAGREIGGLLALKRVNGFQPIGTLYARGVAEVAAQAGRLMPDGQPILVQEYFAGYGVGVNMLMRDGMPLLAFQHRRLREVPVSGGPSALRESVPLDPDLYRHAVRLLAALGWSGLAMVEFRVGRDGHRLMEINGRAWGSLPLAQAAGVDFPAALARLHLGTPDGPPPEPATRLEDLPRYKLGVRSRNLHLDIVWALAVLLRRPRMRIDGWPPRREGLRALAQLLDRRIGFDSQSLDDPAPGLVEVYLLGRYLLRRLLRR